jgi:predicted  nucleic acid-binding Zn-ribbon protein
MRTFKIALAAALTLLAVAACKEPKYVSKEDYDNLAQEYQDLKAGSEAIRQEYADQAQAVDNILQQLSQISGSTLTLRTDMERGTAQMTQVQLIETGLDDIKVKMDELDKATKNNKALRNMVKSLKKVIAEKEAEIESLKAEIKKKDATISAQHQTITEQNGTIENQTATINAQKDNLRAILAEQAQMLFQAGVDFEDLGDEAPEMSLRKNKRKMADFRNAMYQKAIVYYKQAEAAGYPEAAYRISAIEEKLAAQ